LFSYESKQPHDPVDLWLTRAKLGSFGIAGVSLGGAGITYGVSTYGWYGLGAIVLKEAGDAAKDAALEGTIGFSPPTGIRGGLKSVRDFIKRLSPPERTLLEKRRMARLRRGAVSWGPSEGKKSQKGFRVMSQAEIDDVKTNGWRPGPSTMKDKHFLDNHDDAKRWADEVAPDLGFPADGIAEVDIPATILQDVGRTRNVDGIGNGKVVWGRQLSCLPKPITIHPPK
jgi:hypothetical protein